jgi:hypothetical protein
MGELGRSAAPRVELPDRRLARGLFKPLDPDQLRKVGDEALNVARRKKDMHFVIRVT